MWAYGGKYGATIVGRVKSQISNGLQGTFFAFSLATPEWTYILDGAS